jgi:hypothetical protein
MNSRPDNIYKDTPAEHKAKEDQLSTAFLQYLSGTGPFTGWKEDEAKFEQWMVSSLRAVIVVTLFVDLGLGKESHRCLGGVWNSRHRRTEGFRHFTTQNRCEPSGMRPCLF